MVDVDVKWESVLDVVNGKDYFCLCLYHLAWVVDIVPPASQVRVPV